MGHIHVIWHIVKTILQFTNHIHYVSLAQETNSDEVVILGILLWDAIYLALWILINFVRKQECYTVYLLQNRFWGAFIAFILLPSLTPIFLISFTAEIKLITSAFFTILNTSVMFIGVSLVVRNIIHKLQHWYLNRWDITCRSSTARITKCNLWLKIRKQCFTDP